jgi:iron complex outermembrane receptor protein
VVAEILLQAGLASAEPTADLPDAGAGTASEASVSQGQETAPPPPILVPEAPSPATEGESNQGAEPPIDYLAEPLVDQSVSLSSSNDFGELSLESLLSIKVVTASGVAEDRELASANVLVVTRDEIQRRGYHSLGEVLGTIPGLYVIDDLVTPSVSVRGISGGLGAGTRIVRMMIDGEQVNFRPDLTAFLGPEYIPMEAIERVEIAKGPLSALYGANAFLATVNVITRTPKDGFGAEVVARGSQMSKASGGGSGLLSYRKNRTSLLAAFSLNRDDRSGVGLQQTFPAQKYDDASLFSRKSSNDISRPAGGFFAFKTSSDVLGTLSIEGGIQRKDAMGEFQVNSILTDDNRLALQNYWTQARLDRPLTKTLSTAVFAGWSAGAPLDSTHLSLSDSRDSFFRPNYRYNAFNGGLELSWTPLPSFSLRGGFDAERDNERVLYYSQIFNTASGGHQPGDSVDVSMGPNDQRDVVLTNIGTYLQAMSTPLPKTLPDLRATGNLRTDWISQGDVKFPLQTSWRGSLAYRFSPALTAKILAGRAFQTPSAVLTFARPGFGTVGNIVGASTISGGDMLKPQTVTSAEIGAMLKLLGALALEGNIYYQQVSDRIEFVRVGANFRAVNRQDVSSNVGMEGMFRLAKAPVSAYLAGSVQRTIVSGSVSSAPPASYPNAFGVLGCDFDIPKAYLRTNGELRWSMSRGASQGNVLVNNSTPYTLPAYGIVNLSVSTAGLHFIPGSGETRFLVGVRNLLDSRYGEPGFGGFDIPSLGRIVFLELRQLL